MDNSEQLTFLMGSECKLDFSLDYETKSLALTVLQKTEEDEWNMISKVYYRSDHPTKLMRQLKELIPMELLVSIAS